MTPPQKSIFQNPLPGNPVPSFRKPRDKGPNGLDAIKKRLQLRTTKKTYSRGVPKFTISATELPFGAVRLSFSSISQSSRRPGVQVDTMTMLIGPSGKIAATPRAHHHLQSQHYPEKTKNHLNGAEAGKVNADLILGNLEEFGIDFLKTITDPDKADKIAGALLEAQAALTNPNKTFGKGAKLSSLTPENLQRAREFREFAESLLIIRPATGISLQRI